MRSTVLAWPLQRWKIEGNESRAAHSKRHPLLSVALKLLLQEHDEPPHSSSIKDLQAVLKDYAAIKDVKELPELRYTLLCGRQKPHKRTR